ncbi:MAG: hypothetical protein QOG13_279 [Sphingomonadales bacterium]|jgi:hypothetical protein|nr:hypothetical protein [Sphingomonadales bacterium]MEA3042600.1 hypothetical protein [Sphingomonadales bacterium]
MTQKRPPRAGDKAPSAPDFDPVPLRYRRDGCTPQRQVDFIRYLAECGCVVEACRRVGLSSEAVYELARRPDAQSFRLAWEIAMDNAVRRVGDNAFSRALNGISIPHYYKGELVGEHRRWDERLTMFILRYRDPLRYGKHLDRADFSGNIEEKAIILEDALEAVRLDAEREAAGLPRAFVRDVPAANDDEDDDDPFDEGGDGGLPPDVPSTSSTSGRPANRRARRRAAAKGRKR